MICEVAESPLVVALVLSLETLLFDGEDDQEVSFQELHRAVAEWLARARVPGDYARVVTCDADARFLSETAFYGARKVYTFATKTDTSTERSGSDVHETFGHQRVEHSPTYTLLEQLGPKAANFATLVPKRVARRSTPD